MSPEFNEKIKAGWWMDRKGTKMYELIGNLNKIKRTLQELNKDKFNEVELKSYEAMQKLHKCQENIQLDPHYIHLITEETSLSQECKNWNSGRERFLRQKCKVLWLTPVDMNTKFFHSIIKSRRNSNRIISIDNAEGQNITDLEEISKTCITFYEGLLGTNKSDRKHVCSTLVRYVPIVSVV